jgi:hypothetical protein
MAYSIINNQNPPQANGTDNHFALFDTFQVNDLLLCIYNLRTATTNYIPTIADTLNSGSYTNCFCYFNSTVLASSWGASYIPVTAAATVPFIGAGTTVISTNVLTITSVTSGTLLAGASIAGTGISALTSGLSVTIAAYGTGGTTGTGGTGTYQMSINATATESTPVTITAASCVVTLTYNAAQFSVSNMAVFHVRGFTGVPVFDSVGFGSGNGTTTAVSVSASTTYANSYCFGVPFSSNSGVLSGSTATGSAWGDTYISGSELQTIVAFTQSSAGSLSYINSQTGSTTYPWYVGLPSFYSSAGYSYIPSIFGGNQASRGAVSNYVPYFANFSANNLLLAIYSLQNTSGLYTPTISDSLNTGNYTNIYGVYDSVNAQTYGASFIVVNNNAGTPFVGAGTFVLSSNVLTITSVTNGTLLPGATVTNNGSGISQYGIGGAVIAAYGTGGTTGTGGTGTYQMSNTAFVTQSSPVTIMAATLVTTLQYASSAFTYASLAMMQISGFTGTPTFDSAGYGHASGSTNSISVSGSTNYANEYSLAIPYTTVSNGIPNGTPTGGSWASTYLSASTIQTIFTLTQASAGSLSYATTQIASATNEFFIALASFYGATISSNSAIVNWLY